MLLLDVSAKDKPIPYAGALELAGLHSALSGLGKFRRRKKKKNKKSRRRVQASPPPFLRGKRAARFMATMRTSRPAPAPAMEPAMEAPIDIPSQAPEMEMPDEIIEQPAEVIEQPPEEMQDDMPDAEAMEGYGLGFFKKIKKAINRNQNTLRKVAGVLPGAGGAILQTVLGPGGVPVVSNVTTRVTPKPRSSTSSSGFKLDNKAILIGGALLVGLALISRSNK